MTRQQQWATHAYKAVCKVASGSGADRGEYKTLAMKLPALLMRSGLVQTTAFLRSRGEGRAAGFLDDVAETLGEPKATTGESLDRAARTADLGTYLRLSRDALQVATWFRRFAQSELADIDEEGHP